MTTVSETERTLHLFPITNENSNIKLLGSSLTQAVACYKELILDMENIHKKKLQQDNIFSKSCQKCTDYKELITVKDNIIEQVASALTRISETKNLKILDEVFKIICGETTLLTPPKESQTYTVEAVKSEEANPNKKTLSTSASDISFEEPSVMEIEGTPGRSSPILSTKNVRSRLTNDGKTKNVSSKNWPMSETKVIKLLSPSPSCNNKSRGRMRQQRLALTRVKGASVVDLTLSPEVPQDIKREPTDDDTIMPSPTSGITKPNYSYLANSTPKSSPVKFKKPSLMIKVQEKCSRLDVKHEPSAFCVKQEDVTLMEHMDSSESARHHSRSPKKSPPCPAADENAASFDTDVSISLLQQVRRLEAGEDRQKCNTNSPLKRPLGENRNATNVPSELDSDASVSVLLRAAEPSASRVDTIIKRKTPEKVEPVYKEPTVRKKAEKMALPGWYCDECKNFFGILYNDNPAKIAAAVERCSHHRARKDPARPRTPPGYWQPRWDVPDDTAEFNRRNHV